MPKQKLKINKGRELLKIIQRLHEARWRIMLSRSGLRLLFANAIAIAIAIASTTVHRVFAHHSTACNG